MSPAKTLRIHTPSSTRVERDTLGALDLPQEVYFGAETQRALQNFPVSKVLPPEKLVRSYLQVKRAACRANVQLNFLPAEMGLRIERAIEEVETRPLEALSQLFPITAFQAGAGTSLNMNVNEVISHVANLHSTSAGTKIDPHDHVNLHQSTNDTYPTAYLIALIRVTEEVTQEVHLLSREFQKLARKFAPYLKVGRTHLRDAIPMKLSDQFAAYSWTLKDHEKAIHLVESSLMEVPMGGTAVGNGVPAPPQFAKTVVSHLREVSQLPLKEAPNRLALLQSPRAPFRLSSQLRILNLDLIRILRDLRWMTSGPYTGIGELEFPQIQAGSSQMPGKSNPSAAEMLGQVAFHGIGLDQTAALVFQSGELELNVHCPAWSYFFLEHLEELHRGLRVFRILGLEGLKVRPNTLKKNLLATDQWAVYLTPRLGYETLAKAVQEAQELEIPLLDYLRRTGVLTQEEIQKLLQSPLCSEDSSSELSLSGASRFSSPDKKAV